MRIQVTVVDVEHFERENVWVPISDFVEDFVCVTMVNSNGTVFTNFTRADRPFAELASDSIGQVLDLECRFKEDRDCEKFGQRRVVTNCRPFKLSAAAARKEEKRRKRMAALGLG